MPGGEADEAGCWVEGKGRWAVLVHTISKTYFTTERCLPGPSTAVRVLLLLGGQDRPTKFKWPPSPARTHDANSGERPSPPPFRRDTAPPAWILDLNRSGACCQECQLPPDACCDAYKPKLAGGDATRRVRVSAPLMTRRPRSKQS